MMTRRFLVVGFALSLGVHLALAPFARLEPVHAQETPPPDITVMHLPPPPRPTPTPRVTPTPRATPTPLPTLSPPATKSTPAPRHAPIKIVTAHAVAHAGGPAENANMHLNGDPNSAPPGDRTATPGASAVAQTPDAATPPPRPTPTPLSCSRPNVAAKTVRAVEPDMPAPAQQQGISGTVEIVVSLDAASHLVAARLQRSPSVLLDQAALTAARESQFTTEIRNCAPIAADYLFSVDFTSS